MFPKAKYLLQSFPTSLFNFSPQASGNQYDPEHLGSPPQWKCSTTKHRWWMAMLTLLVIMFCLPQKLTLWLNAISDEGGIPLIAWPFILSGGWCILFRCLLSYSDNQGNGGWIVLYFRQTWLYSISPGRNVETQQQIRKDCGGFKELIFYNSKRNLVSKFLGW